LSELVHAPHLETEPSIGADAGADADAGALYARHADRIRAYCVGQLRDRQEAEDALQTTFLYAFTLLERGTKPGRPLPWLYTIAHNVCRTRRRALKRRNLIESPVDLETLHESVGRNDPPREDVAQLETFLTMLPPTQRVALLLREWQGLSYAEIADRLDLTESAVEAVLFRARRNLARRLRPARRRVAALANGLLLLPALRRLAPAASSAKATTAALVLGTAAATTLVPFGDAPRSVTKGRPAPPSKQAPVIPAAPASGAPAARRSVAAPPSSALPPPAGAPAAPAQPTPTPAVPAASAPDAPAPAAPTPAAAPPPAPTSPPKTAGTVTETTKGDAPAIVDTATTAAANVTSTVATTADNLTHDVQQTVTAVTGAVPSVTVPSVTVPNVDPSGLIP
jgi:RNA polymerase sigma factor (sigma-70 family)